MAASRRLPLYRRQHGGHLTQIDELLARLAAADLASAEGALVRLTLQGARTIEPILAAFPQASEAARSRMLRILERVPDRRSLALLNRTAGDGSSGLRRLAVRALGALPARHTLPTLLQLLSREAEPEVRAEIVSILSRQASAESPETLEPVLEILFSQQEAGVVRRAALTSLAGLKPRQSRQLLEKLAAGADDRLGRDIRRLLDAYPADPMSGLPALMTEPPVTAGSVEADTANRPLMNIPHVLATLEAHGDDPETAHRCTRALDTLSTEGRRDLAGRLDPAWPLAIMDAVLDAFRGTSDRAVLSAFAAWVRQLGQRMAAEPDPDQAQQIGARRARVHLLIAEGHSRLAIADLKEALRASGPLSHDLVQALRIIGRGEDLTELLGAHEQADPWMQGEIVSAAAAILRREKPRRRSRLLSSLPEHQAAILLPSPATGETDRRGLSGQPPGENPA